MPSRNVKNDKSERLLILAIDIDNDLYRKTKISGPILGRVQNLNAATQLVLADPEESDANNMFQAVKLYDELKKEGYQVNVATVTGSEREGYEADREVSRQLELVLAEYKSDACIFVTDGASDQRVLPIIDSRIKINSVKVVTMKQAPQLENTYFVILEKLKEPHYARIIFGIPAVLLILFAISYSIGAGWQLPAALIGVYLLAKGFGLENAFIDSFRGFGFSIDRMSFVFYLSAIIFFIANLFIGYGNFVSESQITGSLILTVAYAVEGFLFLLPATLTFYLIGRALDTKSQKYVFRVYKYGLYISYSLILGGLIYSFVSWIIGQIDFGQFLFYTFLSIAAGVAISLFTDYLRRRALKTRRIKDKLVVNELGAMIGKVAGVDIKHGLMKINTSFGNPVTYNVDRIVDISDKVIIK